MKSVKVGVGYGDKTKYPPIGKGSSCRAKVFKNRTVWLNTDDLKKALVEYTESGHDPQTFRFLIARFEENALDQAYPPQWKKDWMKELKSQSMIHKEDP